MAEEKEKASMKKNQETVASPEGKFGDLTDADLEQVAGGQDTQCTGGSTTTVAPCAWRDCTHTK